MKITIISVGKIKERFYKDAVEEYAKRLQKYCKLDIIEVPDEKTPDSASQHQMELIKEKEAEGILRHIKKDAYVVTLEIMGKGLDSTAFAKKIEHLGITGTSHIQFIIGGSLGLHSSVSAAAQDKISFSHMTFPHQLMRVILVEQIYRSFRIMQNEPYHK